MLNLRNLKKAVYKGIGVAAAAVFIAGTAAACTGQKSGEIQEQSNTGQTQEAAGSSEGTAGGGNTAGSSGGTASGESTAGSSESTADSSQGTAVLESDTKEEDNSAIAEQSNIYHLDLLADKSLENYDSAKVKEIIMEPEGSSFVFWTEKTLTDLKLIGVDYDGDQFMEKEIFCSYDTFTSEDALLITHFFSEDMADLKLTFYDDIGQLKALYITQDGQSTAPVMVSEESLLFP